MCDFKSFLKMENKNMWIKYFSPLIGVLFCPVTILFLWSIWSGPVVEYQNDLIEEEQKQ